MIGAKMAIFTEISDPFDDSANGGDQAGQVVLPAIPPSPPRIKDPAWRWHAVLDWLRNEGSRRGAGKEDAVIRHYLEPYLRERCGLPCSARRLTDPEYAAVQKAVVLYSEKQRKIQLHTIPFDLEAGIVAGLEAGAVLPTADDVDPVVQWFYEAFFFSTVRARRHDREWLLRHVFLRPRQQTQTAQWGFKAKLYAHLLGGDWYVVWRLGGERSPKAKWLSRLIPPVMAYLDGLKTLGIARPGDRVKAFRWMFEKAESEGEKEMADAAFETFATVSEG